GKVRILSTRLLGMREEWLTKAERPRAGDSRTTRDFGQKPQSARALARSIDSRSVTRRSLRFRGLQLDFAAIRDPAGGFRLSRHSPRMNRAAASAGALIAAGVEFLEGRHQIAVDIAHLGLHAMKQRMARGAEPFESVDDALGTLALDDEADAAGLRPLRRVPHIRRQQEHFAGTDRDVARPALIHHPQHDIALDLIEEFLEGIVMEVGPGIGPADHEHDEIAVAPDFRIADRRLQQMAMLLHPFSEIERLGIEIHYLLRCRCRRSAPLHSRRCAGLTFWFIRKTLFGS